MPSLKKFKVKKKKIELLSNFNITSLYEFLEQDLNKKKYYLKKPSYGQFFQKILNLIKSKTPNDISIVWTQAEHTFECFKKILNYETVSDSILKKEADQYIIFLKNLSDKTKHLIIFSWTLPRYERGRFLNDFTNEMGLTHKINILNNYVSDSLRKNKNVYFINSDLIIKENIHDYNPKLWYAAKVPFTQNTFQIASKEIQNIINFTEGKSIKLIILDLDNTLWGGVLGDAGWQKLKIGGHSIAGESFENFQNKLKALNNLGVQLAICSKNDEHTALEAIEKNPNMILKKKNFSSWKINWDDKAENIRKIITELNLSAENVLFIDDSVIERDRVKKSIKEIKVPEWPNDPSQYVKKLFELGCFNYSSISTSEDLNRTKYYKDNLKRNKSKELLSEENWLKSLKTHVYFKKIAETNKDRIYQLLQRTNQMNLSTNRLTVKDLDKLQKNKNNYLYCCSVKDKFGDMGIIGFFNLKIEKEKGCVKDFILSCRAFGREIENSMIYKIVQILKSKNIKYLELNYKKTKKNKPCLSFLNNNFKRKKNRFFLHGFKDQLKPKTLKIN